MIQKSEAESIITLELNSNFQVKDFTGIEYLKNLQNLWIYYLFDGEADEKSTVLTQLTEKLSGMEHLNTLSFPDDTIVTQDAANFLYTMHLQTLLGVLTDDADMLYPKDTTGKPLFDSLQELSITVNGELSLSGLTAFKNLSHLSITLNNNSTFGSDLKALSSFKNLESFSMWADLSGFTIDTSDCGSLTSLELYNLHTTNRNFPVIQTKGLKNLTELALSDFVIEGSLGDLNNQIRRLHINNSVLPDSSDKLDLSSYTEIYSLSLVNLGLKEVTGLENMSSLWELSLDDNNLTAVPKLSKDADALSSLGLQNNQISDISALAEINANAPLTTIYLQNNCITDLSALTKSAAIKEHLSLFGCSNNKLKSLPDFSGFANLETLMLQSNQLETLEGANLQTLTFRSLNLSDNKLTRETVIGFVPEKFSADLDWLARATSTSIKYSPVSYPETVYTWLNSELIASDLDSHLNGTGSIYLSYTTCADSLKIEKELLEYIRGLDRNVILDIYYVDVESSLNTGVVNCDFSKVPEDVTELTLNLNAVKMEKAPSDIAAILGSDCVYSNLEEAYSNPDYVTTRTFYHETGFNIYASKNGTLKPVKRNIYGAVLLNYIKNGTYASEEYYYIPSAKDTTYGYTTENGTYSTPERYDYSSITKDALEAAIESAKEGDHISVAATTDTLNISKELWNSFIEKKLTADISCVNIYNEIEYVFHLNYADMKELTEGDWLELNASIQRYQYDIDGLIAATINVTLCTRNDNNSYFGTGYPDFKATISVYAGTDVANNEICRPYLSSDYVLGKDMKKYLVYNRGDKEYTVKAGMVTVPAETSSTSISLIADSLISEHPDEAEIPNYENKVVYNDKDLILETAGQQVSNLNVKGTGNDLTIVSTFDVNTSSSEYTPLFTLDSRSNNTDGSNLAIEAYITDQELSLSSNINTFTNYVNLDDLFPENGTYTLTLHLYQSGSSCHLTAVLNDEKVYESNWSFIDISSINTFFNYDYSIENGTYEPDANSAASNVRTKIYAGAVLPDGITEEKPTTKPEETTTDKSEETTTGKTEETTTSKTEETTTGKTEETTTSKTEETTTSKVEETTTGKTEETTTSKAEETTTGKTEETTASGKSEPAKVNSSKIVEAGKVLSTAVDKMKESILKTIEVVSDAAQTLTKDVFDTLQKEGKNLTVGVTDENQQLQYSWTFSNRTVTNTDMNIDLSIKFDSEKKDEIQKLTGRDNAMYLSFGHHGKLPGPATIKSYVGNNYKDGEKIYLYYFDEEQGKILMVGNSALEVKNGYVEYTITHCSTYLLLEEKLDGVEKDVRSLDNASISVLDENAVLTINGTPIATNESVTETTTKSANAKTTTAAKDSSIPGTGDTNGNSVRILFMMFGCAAIAVLASSMVRNKNRK